MLEINDQLVRFFLLLVSHIQMLYFPGLILENTFASFLMSYVCQCIGSSTAGGVVNVQAIKKWEGMGLAL